MIPVTDPQLLQELNGSSGLKPVSDPALLSELHGNSSAQSAQQPQSALQKIGSSNWNPGIGGLLQDLSNSSGVNAVLGFGDALKNMIANTANVIPGVNIPQTKSADGTAYTLGNIGGNIAGFLGGGELLNGARLAAKGLPLIGEAAAALEGSKTAEMSRRILGSGIYGAIETPEDRLKGSVVGGALGAGAEALPGALGLFTKPRELAKGIQDFIGQQVSKAKGLYDDVLGKAGNEQISTMQSPFGSNYSSVDKNIFNVDRDIRNLHDEFVKNPTVGNAHKLQSQIGYEIRQYQKSPNLSITDNNTVKELQYARESIRNDLINHLDNSTPGLGQNYKDATNIYRSIVEPANALDKFSNPSTKDISKTLGKLVDKKQSQQNIAPELQDQISSLKNSLAVRNLATIGTAGGLGLLGVGNHIISPVEAIAGLAGGKFLGAKSPQAANEIAQNLLMALQKTGQGLGTLGKANIPGAMQ